MNSVHMDEEFLGRGGGRTYLPIPLPPLCALGAEEPPSEAGHLIGRSHNQMPQF